MSGQFLTCKGFLAWGEEKLSMVEAQALCKSDVKGKLSLSLDLHIFAATSPPRPLPPHPELLPRAGCPSSILNIMSANGMTCSLCAEHFAGLILQNLNYDSRASTSEVCHFTEELIEAQKGKVPCSGHTASQHQSQGSSSRLPSSRAQESSPPQWS